MSSQAQWLMPVGLATQEAEIRFEASPGKVFQETLSQKRAGGVAQGIGPEFKLQY
jgi:hypothetical protein